MSRIPPELAEKFAAIEARNYAGQAKWVLNGFWEELQGEAEKIWGFAEVYHFRFPIFPFFFC